LNSGITRLCHRMMYFNASMTASWSLRDELTWLWQGFIEFKFKKVNIATFRCKFLIQALLNCTEDLLISTLQWQPAGACIINWLDCSRKSFNKYVKSKSAISDVSFDFKPYWTQRLIYFNPLMMASWSMHNELTWL
jgi:hypothetical protein